MSPPSDYAFRQLAAVVFIILGIISVVLGFLHFFCV